MSAVSDVAGRVPERLWVRLAAWLIGLERDGLDADLVVTLHVRRGVVARVRITPPDEVVTRRTEG